MCATSSAARRRARVAKPLLGRSVCLSPPLVVTELASNLAEGAGCSYVDLGDSVRLAFVITPRDSGKIREQVREVFSVMRTVLERQSQPMAVTVQTVFLKDARDKAACQRVFAELYGPKLPVTNFVLQPPCGGESLAVEAWAIGGKGVRVEHFGPRALAVSYDSVRWVYCAGVTPGASVRGVYPQTLDVLGRLRTTLADAGSSFERVVRTWFYLGGITDPEPAGQRYQELNRARTDFYRDIRFDCSLRNRSVRSSVYPASTGIGMAGHGLVMSCMALETAACVS
jgi:enamine deaminase RidA (YjgF/YER057c/UK114 family)